MRVLILGGTTEARDLSRALEGRPEVQATVSLVGYTTEVADHRSTVRTGGFGGADGLARHLRDEGIDAVVDATHPFASMMPSNAATACATVGVPRLRLVRPPWRPGPGDQWTEVDDLVGAAEAVRRSGARRVLLTTGRLELAPFVGISGVSYVLRAIEDPGPLPFPAEVVLARGPFTVDDEIALLTDTGAELLVSKNSGGDDAKLVAARRTGRPVVMVRRPAPAGGPTVEDVSHALAWLRSLARDRHRADAGDDAIR